MLHSYDSIHANFICEQQNIANIFTAHTAVSNTVLVVSLTAVVEILLHSWDVRVAACSPGIMLYSFKKHIWEGFFFLTTNIYVVSRCVWRRDTEKYRVWPKKHHPHSEAWRWKHYALGIFFSAKGTGQLHRTEGPVGEATYPKQSTKAKKELLRRSSTLRWWRGRASLQPSVVWVAKQQPRSFCKEEWAKILKCA